jgi:hypothetical protein
MVSNRVMNLALTTAMFTDGWNYDPCWDEASFDVAAKQLRKVVRDGYAKAKVAHGVYRTTVLLKDWVLKVSHTNDVKALLAEAEFIAKMRSTPTFRKHFPKTFAVPFGKNHAVLIQERIAVMPDSELSERYWDAVDDFAAQFGIADMHQENFGWAGPRGKEYPVFIDVDSRYRPAAKKFMSWDRFLLMHGRY